MRELNMEKSVSRLDGFLSGLSACNGKIRDYSAYCFAVSLDGDASVEAAIRSHFSWLSSLDFSDVHILENGLRDLEIEIRPFLVRDSRYGSVEEISSLQKYLSFQVMEEISIVVSENGVIQVLRLTAVSNPESSDSVFFCVRLKSNLIVMQFNSDIKFKNSILR
jgi:hypothetical protein